MRISKIVTGSLLLIGILTLIYRDEFNLMIEKTYSYIEEEVFHKEPKVKFEYGTNDEGKEILIEKYGRVSPVYYIKVDEDDIYNIINNMGSKGAPLDYFFDIKERNQNILVKNFKEYSLSEKINEELILNFRFISDGVDIYLNFSGTEIFYNEEKKECYPYYKPFTNFLK